MADILDHHLPYTETVQKYVGDGIHAFFESMGIEADIFKGIFLNYNPQYALIDQVLQSWLIMALVLIICWIMTRRLRTVPKGGQHVLELTVLGFRDMLEDIVGHGGAKHLPFIASAGIFIFFGNLAGLFPFSMSPTANLNVTIALAIMSFIYYNYQGLKTQGVVSYVGHFFGPKLPVYLFPVNLLLFPIEVISHLARPMSLAIRLFGNIMGEDIVFLILASMFAYFLPLPMMGLMLFSSFLQAFVFTILSVMYIAGATAEEH